MGYVNLMVPQSAPVQATCHTECDSRIERDRVTFVCLKASQLTQLNKWQFTSAQVATVMLDFEKQYFSRQNGTFIRGFLCNLEFDAIFTLLTNSQGLSSLCQI